MSLFVVLWTFTSEVRLNSQYVAQRYFRKEVLFSNRILAGVYIIWPPTPVQKWLWNTKNISSKNTWSTWARKSYGVQQYPAWVWVGLALGLRAKLFKIWSHGTKKFCSKISIHKVSKVPWRYFVGFWRQDSFSGLTG